MTSKQKDHTTSSDAKGRLRISLRENREILKFCFLFALILGVFTILLQINAAQTNFVEPHLHQIASACGKVLSALGTQCDVAGSSITSSRFSVNIVRGCDSLYPTAMLWAALLAYPATWKSKTIGVIGGAIVLFLMNIVRVVTMFYIGVYFPSLFDMFHIYAWQALFILLTLAVWLFWAAKFAGAKASIRR
ncbi:MAG: exosortase H [Ignavibacteriae bacterium]|nr:exosortase H [Ignavibacteria bacterium]MBI3364366.1 exosortase H [Ignavibacteriota bacterium]